MSSYSARNLLERVEGSMLKRATTAAAVPTMARAAIALVDVLIVVWVLLSCKINFNSYIYNKRQ